MTRLRRSFRQLDRTHHSRARRPRLPGVTKDLGLICVGGLLGAAGMTMAFEIDWRPEAVFASYPNCREAIQAGVAPIRRGQPGYRSILDADNDGVACEVYSRGP